MKEYWKQIDKDGPMFDFKDYYQKIAESLPDHSRLFEVGLANGKSFIYMAEALLNLGKTWDRYVGIDNCDYGHGNQRNDITENLINAGIKKLEFWDMDSLAASCKFPDGYFNFGFLDSSHTYPGTRAEIMLWYNKIKDGGILAGHDYYLLNGSEVQLAVNEMIYPEKLTIHETEKGCGIWETRKDGFLKQIR